MTPLLRNRGFLWLWGGEGISQFGAQFTYVALPVLAVSLLDASEWEVGVLNAAQTAAFLVIALPAGAWIDRMLKRRVMIVADLVRAVALAALPLLWWAGVLDIWHLYLFAIVFGIARVFFDVGYQSFLPILLPSAQVGSANSRLEATSQVASVAGPGIAGLVLTVLSAPVILLADAISYLVSAFAIWRIRDGETLPERETRQPLRREIAEGMRFVFAHPLLRRITLCTGTSNLFSTIVTTLEAVLILRVLDLGPAGLGVILGVGSVGGLLGAIATPWITRRIGEGTAISLAAVAMGVAAAAFPLAGMVPAVGLPVLIAGMFVESFLVLVYNITQVTMRQRLTLPRLLGRMNASIRFVVWGVMPIGALIAGVLGTALGVVPTMWIGAIGTALAAGWVLFSPLTTMKVLPTELEAQPVEVGEVAERLAGDESDEPSGRDAGR
jgi:predicted MFS family arabinose efflux permease